MLFKVRLNDSYSEAVTLYSEETQISPADALTDRMCLSMVRH